MTPEQLPVWRRPIYATRTSAHLVFGIGVWPLLTILTTTVDMMNQPYLAANHEVAFKATLAGVGLAFLDLAVAGSVFFGLSGAIFARLGPAAGSQPFGFARLGIEPLLAFAAGVTGAAMFYPSVLSLPLFAPLSTLPVAVIVGLLCTGVIAGGFLAARRGKGLQLAAALMALAVSGPLSGRARSALEYFVAHPPDVVLLGLDSISQHDDVGEFKAWAKQRHGTWYERAVTPGLLTNAVWGSILTMRPVSAHRVFHTFERLNSEPALLTAARTKGYHTVSIFPDQLTCAVGSRAGFDEDRSGPIGWRQLVLPILSNNSFLVPIVRPLLPDGRSMATRANQAGSFSYDVRREIRGIFRAGSSRQRTLVAAHLTYLHLAAYPSSLDLTWPELWHIARAPAHLVRDRTFDWQDADGPTDPIQLHDWKLRFLQRAIEEEVDSARYLDGERKLVIFSDHGHRLGLSVHNFGHERYHHVVLVTFGLNPQCAREPISLIDIGRLIGLSKRQAEPAVEFAIAPLNLWPALMNTAKLRWEGDVDLDADLLAEVFAGLQRYEPWPGRSTSCLQ